MIMYAWRPAFQLLSRAGFPRARHTFLAFCIRVPLRSTAAFFHHVLAGLHGSGGGVLHHYP